ncbi:MAG TPA: prolyl oligopeptidase family serine peptidase [Xanthomonadales bacterium]|nr:prolyl oligopeptidase family serine peptidase [Xanthomonadales bacterium]
MPLFHNYKTLFSRTLNRFAIRLGAKPGFVLLIAFASPLLAEVEERTLNNGQLILQDIPEIPLWLADRVQQYQNVRSASFQGWTEDGQGIYIKTRIGNTQQIHRVRQPGGTRNQLTFFKEPVGEVEAQPQGPAVAFTMDKGGSEFAQIFLLDPKTGESSLLTDGKSRNRVVLWDKQGKQLAFQTTRRNGKDNDVWIMPADNPEAARPIYESNDGSWWGPGDFSEDGRYMLLQQFISVEDSRIHVVDLESDYMRTVAGDKNNPSANRVVSFSKTEAGLYFITNDRGRAAELAWRPLARDRKTDYITTDIPWDVTEFALSDDGKRGAFVTNEWGVSRLYLLDTVTHKFKAVDNLPVGVIFGLSFNPDNRRLALTMNTPQTPSDVFVMDLGRRATRAGTLTRWTFSEVGGLDTEDFVQPQLIQYPTFDMDGEEPRQVPAFVYRPRARGPHPVVIHVHGGPEIQYRPFFNSTFQMWLAELGAAVIAPNIRGSLGNGFEYLSLDNGYKREDAVKDIGALLDWIKEQPELDENRVVITGSSYGGYMVLASAVHYSERLSGGVDTVGISNFVTFLENTQSYRRDLRRAEYGDERDPEMRVFLESISPINNVDKINIPLLVVQGENDPRVPVRQSTQIVKALRERNVPVWYMNALNEGHGYERKENFDIYQQVMLMFLDRFLAPQD